MLVFRSVHQTKNIVIQLVDVVDGALGYFLNLRFLISQLHTISVHIVVLEIILLYPSFLKT